MTAVRRVVLAEPRGFCAGVEVAIKSLAWMVKLFGPPVYCYHEIVHNRSVVARFEQAGVVFVDDVTMVPRGAPLLLSAHGSAPDVVASARDTGRVVIDAVCPLVTKVHHELKLRAERGYQVVYVGHRDHDETIGTLSVAPAAAHLVETVADVERLELDGARVALLAQTTLSVDEWDDVRRAVQRRFDEVWEPRRDDLCFATTNRQRAVKELAAVVDAIVVIGSATSSNTDAIEHVARASGCRRVERIDTAADLPADLGGVVGVTAGASVPDELVQDVVRALEPEEGTETLTVTVEDEYFPLPIGVRDRLDPAALHADRQTSASEMLRQLCSGTGG